MPGKKKKYNARFPPARIKKIMQTDEDVGKVAAAVPVIISRSLELFIDSLIERTASVTRAKNAKTLSTSHIKQAIHSEKTFDFLRDLVKAIPDHQVDEDGDGTGAGASGGPPQEKKPKTTRPRKPREEGAPRGRGRPRKVKPEPEVKKSSSSDEEDDEETETDEEGLTSQEEVGPAGHTSNSPAHTSPAHTNPPQASSSPAYTSPLQGAGNTGFANPAVPTSNNQGLSNPAQMSDGSPESMGNTPVYTELLPPTSHTPAFTSPVQTPNNPGSTSSGAATYPNPAQPLATYPNPAQPPATYPNPDRPPATYPNPAQPPVQPPPQISLPQPQGLPLVVDQSQTSSVASQAPTSAPHNSTAPSEHLNHSHFTRPLLTQRLFQPRQAFPMHNFQFPQYGMMGPGGQQLGPPPFLTPGSSISPQHSPLPPNMAPGMMPYPPYMAPHSPFPGRPEGPGIGPNGTVSGAQYPGHPKGQPTTTAGQTTGGQAAGKAEPTNNHDANMPLDMSIPGKSRHPSQPQSQGVAGAGQPSQLTTVPVPRGLPPLVPHCYPGGAPHPQGVPGPTLHQPPALHQPHLQNQHHPVQQRPQQVHHPVQQMPQQVHHPGHLVPQQMHHPGQEGPRNVHHPGQEGPQNVHHPVQGPPGHGQHAPHMYPPHPGAAPINFYNQPQENKAISADEKTDSRKGDNSSVLVSRTSKTAEDTSGVHTGTRDQVKGLVSFPGLSNIMKVNSKRPVSNDDDDDYDT